MFRCLPILHKHKMCWRTNRRASRNRSRRLKRKSRTRSRFKARTRRSSRRKSKRRFRKINRKPSLRAGDESSCVRRGRSGQRALWKFQRGRGQRRFRNHGRRRRFRNEIRLVRPRHSAEGCGELAEVRSRSQDYQRRSAFTSHSMLRATGIRRMCRLNKPAACLRLIFPQCGRCRGSTRSVPCLPIIRAARSPSSIGSTTRGERNVLAARNQLGTRARRA